MASGVQANADCVNIFNELKINRAFKYIVYALQDNKDIVVEQKATASPDKSNLEFYNEFITHLPEDQPRYGVFDFEFEKGDGSGKRNRIVFVTWAPDSSSIKQKMVYSSSKEALRRGLVGIQVDVQATDSAESSYEIVLDKCDKLR